MPQARPAQPPKVPCQLPGSLVAFIKNVAIETFGSDVVVRNYGTDIGAWRLHVEVGADTGMGPAVFIGQLLTRIDHIPLVEVTVRGQRPKGDAKIAYRQGVIL